MTITYPRSFPLTRFARGRLTLPPAVSVNLLAGGETQSRRMIDDRWRGEFTTPALTANTDLRTWLAWLASLQQGTKTFYAFDPRFPYPRAYEDGFTGLTKAVGGADFTGAGDVDAISTTGMTISGLPASFALKAGDRVGLIESSDRGLHQITEDATANGSGIVSVTVEPLINTTLFTTAATVQFASPVCIMILEPGSATEPDGREPGPVSFRGIQKVF
ncbi:MAG: hypothetical protein VW338_00855 [Rhodospirillaceae bacterium]